jgi:hypothetical protein
VQVMIRFFKEVYLTGFVLWFRFSRSKNFNYKAGGAVAIVTLVESLVLMGISFCVEMFVGKRLILPKPIVIITFLALSLVNGYLLISRSYGVKFDREFDELEKSRRIVLVVSCVVVALGAIVFNVYSGIAYRHFIGL